jgi:hypothetical protein
LEANSCEFTPIRNIFQWGYNAEIWGLRLLCHHFHRGEHASFLCIFGGNKTSTTSTTSATTSAGANVDGDPHIETLDGNRYTLLNQGSQGTFSLWHHYSDLLRAPSLYERLASCDIVGKSGGSQCQVLDITSRDCEWRVQKGNGSEWIAAQNEEVVSVPDGMKLYDWFHCQKAEWTEGSQQRAAQHADQRWQKRHRCAEPHAQHS